MSRLTTISKAIKLGDGDEYLQACAINLKLKPSDYKLMAAYGHKALAPMDFLRLKTIAADMERVAEDLKKDSEMQLEVLKERKVQLDKFIEDLNTEMDIEDAMKGFE